nr:MAG TPA: hypothetical protein [Caudoviricetes sp.]
MQDALLGKSQKISAIYTVGDDRRRFFINSNYRSNR